ncbi:MFS transporter [Pseudonocardia endophytica]|uniref:MFS transporter n=1 Tax=Pseudonocardia endophytica TaxID=401976 RepID=UPI001FB3B3E0|nr:MFS transporter [Pseudonocardia endophytica]
MHAERSSPVPRLSQAAAFAGLAVTFTVVMLGATLPTPMYALYQQELRFSPITQTVIFSVYAVGVLAALVLTGRWSDLVGRRPMLLAGLGFALVSSVVFLLAGPVWVLLLGRLLSGLSAGIFAGTATAAVVEAAPESWRTRASAVATAANIGGLGLGPLLAGIFVQYLPAPLHLSFAVHAVAVALCVLIVWSAPETVTPTPGVRLRPQPVRVPAAVRPVFVSAATAGFAGFAVTGLFAAISPRLVSEIVGNPNHAVAGLVAFLLLGSSAASQLVANRFDAGVMLRLGCVGLVVGMALVGLSVATGSMALLATGAVVAGVGQGPTLSSGLKTVNARVDPDQRAEVTSSYFVVLYVALSLPVIGLGAASQSWGLRTSGIAFCAGVAVLAVVSLVALTLLARRSARKEAAATPR